MKERVLDLLASIQNHSAFRQFPHAIQDRVRLFEREVLGWRNQRVQAYFDGYKAGLANEVDDWNKSDEEIWEIARRYAGE